MLTEQNKTKHRAYFFHSASHTAAGTVALQKPKGTIAKSRAIALLPLNNALIFVSSCPLVGTQARSLLVSQRHISTTLPYNMRHSLKRYVHLFHTFSLFRPFFFFFIRRVRSFTPFNLKTLLYTQDLLQTASSLPRAANSHFHLPRTLGAADPHGCEQNILLLSMLQLHWMWGKPSSPIWFTGVLH